MDDWQVPSRHRRSIRLRGYDYSQAGAYFFTLCIRNRECLLGAIADGEMRLSEAGRIVQTVWEELSEHYPHVELDGWVVMPNHVHGVVMFDGSVGAGLKPALTGAKPAPTITNMKRHGLPEIIRALKTFSARRINQMYGTPGTSVWPRNYYEHIVRDEDSLDRIRQYIAQNPARWAEDKENPGRTVGEMQQ